MGFKDFIGKVLPTIGTALALPPPLGQMAAAAISKTIGVPVTPDTAEKEIEAAQAKDPEILLKLKQADNDFQLQLKKLDIDLDHIAAEDRANARGREISVKDNTNKILAYITVAGFFAALVGLITRDIPGTTRDLIMVLLGVLAGAFKDVFGYYYGSSSGSAKKTDVIAGVVEATRQ